MQIVRTLLRMLIGGLFIGHGTQKLFGWFGGYGPDGTGQFFEQVGLRPGKRNAIIAGASEAGGGTLLAAGLCTPVAGALLTGVMWQAVRSVKPDKGPFASDGGWELEALFAAAALTVVETGPGPISLDHALGIERSGTLWALLALGAGLAGPTILVGGGGAAEPPSPDTAVAAPAGTPEAADAGASS